MDKYKTILLFTPFPCIDLNVAKLQIHVLFHLRPLTTLGMKWLCSWPSKTVVDSTQMRTNRRTWRTSHHNVFIANTETATEIITLWVAKQSSGAIDGGNKTIFKIHFCGREEISDSLLLETGGNPTFLPLPKRKFINGLQLLTDWMRNRLSVRVGWSFSMLVCHLQRLRKNILFRLITLLSTE